MYASVFVFRQHSRAHGRRCTNSLGQLTSIGGSDVYADEESNGTWAPSALALEGWDCPGKTSFVKGALPRKWFA
jgi:hypothetical protein